MLITASAVSANLRTIQNMFNKKEYEKAEKQLEQEMGGFHGKTLDNARLLLARLKTNTFSAISIYRDLVSSGSEREALQARIELAKIYYSTGNYREVTDLLARIPDNARSSDRLEAVYFRGLSWKEIGDISRATGDFEMIDRGVYLYWGYMALAEIDIKYGRLAEAVERYEMIASSHSNPVAGFKLGECYESLGEKEKALNVYRNLARLFPESLEAPKSREKIEMITISGERTRLGERTGGGDRRDIKNTAETGTKSETQYYTLQFGAFSIEENAIAFAEQLEVYIDGLKIESFETRGRMWHRVRVGRYNTREKAEADAMRFMEQSGYSSKILPVD
ncbi:MAG: SPOR domain-containing protein [Candidatus Krumholzibacteriota bacterium]|nr:SPOR domain-containing protein [Candidatus Krumholzibacteriota bacterium]